MTGTTAPPPGGFTDVGLHTGGKARSTPWPLLLAVIESLMTQHRAVVCDGGWQGDERSLVRMMLAKFDLWVLDSLLEHQKAEAGSAMSRRVVEIWAMHVLQQATIKLGALADDGYDVQRLEEHCEHARRCIEALAQQRHGTASTCLLPEKLSMPMLSYSHMTLHVPDSSSPTSVDASGDIGSMRSLAKENLGGLAWLDVGSADINDLQSWMKKLSPVHSATSVQLQLVIVAMESWLYRLSLKLKKSLVPSRLGGEPFVKSLEWSLDFYRLSMDTFRDTIIEEGSRSQMMMVELRSREWLCVWIAYCLVHKELKHMVPLVGKYGVALRWKDLEHLVLSHRDAWEATTHVKDYLQDHYGLAQQPLFCLRGKTATYPFAERYAEGDVSMEEIWGRESRQAADREDRQWEQIKRQQEAAKTLRLEIRKLSADVAAAESDLYDLEARDRRSRYPCNSHLDHEIIMAQHS